MQETMKDKMSVKSQLWSWSEWKNWEIQHGYV